TWVIEGLARCLVSRVHFEALYEKRLEPSPRLRSCDIGKVRPNALDMRREFPARIKIVLTGQGNADYAERSPSKCVWILAARRLLVDRPEAHQRVDLVRKCRRDRYQIGGHKVVRSLRLVVVLAGMGDG